VFHEIEYKRENSPKFPCAMTHVALVCQILTKIKEERAANQ
jgi:hypothetical protein